MFFIVPHLLYLHNGLLHDVWNVHHFIGNLQHNHSTHTNQLHTAMSSYHVIWCHVLVIWIPLHDFCYIACIPNIFNKLLVEQIIYMTLSLHLIWLCQTIWCQVITWIFFTISYIWLCCELCQLIQHTIEQRFALTQVSITWCHMYVIRMSCAINLIQHFTYSWYIHD